MGEDGEVGQNKGTIIDERGALMFRGEKCIPSVLVLFPLLPLYGENIMLLLVLLGFVMLLLLVLISVLIALLLLLLLVLLLITFATFVTSVGILFTVLLVVAVVSVDEMEGVGGEVPISIILHLLPRGSKVEGDSDGEVGNCDDNCENNCKFSCDI